MKQSNRTRKKPPNTITHLTSSRLAITITVKIIRSREENTILPFAQASEADKDPKLFVFNAFRRSTGPKAEPVTAATRQARRHLPPEMPQIALFSLSLALSLHNLGEVRGQNEAPLATLASSFALRRNWKAFQSGRFPPGTATNTHAGLGEAR